MKNTLLLFVMVLMAGSLQAQTFIDSGISYTVTGPGEIQVDSYQCYSGALVIPSMVTYLSVDYSVTHMGGYAFYQCTTLNSVVVPDSVTSFGDGVFRECTALTSVTLPSSITSIAPQTFLFCSSLTSVVVPNLVTSLEIYAFYGCTNLTSVTLPASLVTVGDYAFYQCTNLATIAIPDSVTSFGYASFADSPALSSITIPNGMTSIGLYAFYHCFGLTSVYSLTNSPIVINGTVFEAVNLSAVTLYVPTSSDVSAYQAATIWQLFNPIVPLVVETNTYYQDLDNDGYGNTAVSVEAEMPPAGYVLAEGDCDDGNAAVNPGATEICYNNIDDNCDGTKSEACAPIPVTVITPGTITNFSIALSAFPYNYYGPGTKGYKFEIRNMQTNEVRTLIQSGTFARFFFIPTDIRGFNTTYQIRAAAIINGEELNYLVAPVSVTSHGIPTITLSSFSCNTLLSRNNATLSANPAFNVVLYTFRLRLTSDSGPTPTYYYVETPSRFTSLSQFAGLTVMSGTSYSIAVQYTSNNNGVELLSDYGAECTVITPGAVARTAKTPFTVTGYPNPFSTGFMLSVADGDTSFLTVRVYDMLGRLVEQHAVKGGEVNSLLLGTDLPAGVYNVLVAQEDALRTIRMIKR